MKFKKRYLFLVFAFLVLLSALMSSLWYKTNSQPVSSDSTKKDFLITKGRGATQVAQDLYKNGLVRSPLAFKIYVQLQGVATSIKPGKYSLSPNLSLEETVDLLVKGPKDLEVTIPEGLRREEIAAKLIKGLEMDEGKSKVFLADFLSASKGMEGYLFPDTYYFPRETEASKVVSVMRQTFDKRVDQKMRSDITKSGRTLEQIIIMASILEKETKDKDKDERPVVSGILWKRLDEGWPLQADATVQYAISGLKCKTLVLDCDWWPDNLTKEDLEMVSPYNTYKNKSLPPTPISNPGLSTVNASVYPKPSDYWFYLHDKEGKVHFAKDITEHNENIKNYLGD